MELKELKIPKTKTLLGLGADGNASLCLFKKGKAFLYTGFGNLQDYKNYQAYTSLAEQMVLEKPWAIACDLNPAFFSTKLAYKLTSKPVLVQHHLAHAYSAAFEHGIKDFASIVCDGNGYGLDGKAWGGEVFHNAHRIGSLEEQPLLGGDSATMNPERFLLGMLRFLDKDKIIELMQPWLDARETSTLINQLGQDYNIIQTTSTGRLFDAVCFLLGFCQKRTYDGEPAVVLEENSSESYSLIPGITVQAGRKVLLTTHLIRWIHQHLDEDKSRLAATAQNYIAQGLFEIAKETKKPVVFSGGCAVNRIMRGHLEKKVLFNKEVSPGDLGISYGQAAYLTTM